MKDAASPKLKIFGKNLEKLNKTQQASVSRMNLLANKHFGNIISLSRKIETAAITAGIAVASITVKSGVERAKELEALNVTLSTVIKSEERLAGIRQKISKLAVDTPFEMPELASAAVNLENFGLDTHKWISTVGDLTYAAGDGRSAAEVALAVAKGTQGNYARLTQIGITRELVDEFKKKNNIQSDVDALFDFLTDKYGGAMEKASKTLSGRWSTVADNFQSASARILGVADDGSIRAGSMYDVLLSQLEKANQKLEEMGENGSLDRLAGMVSNVSTAIGKLIDIIAAVPEAAVGIVGLAVAFDTVAKAIETARSIQTAYNTVKAFAITLESKHGATLFTNLVLGKTKLQTEILSTLAQQRENITITKNIALLRIKTAWQSLVNKVAMQNPYVALATVALGMMGAVALTSLIANNLKGVGNNATGTQYWRGGRTWVGEHGPEVVDLPSGSKVYSNSKSRGMLGGGNTINITVNGANMTNDQVADTIAARLLAVLDNA